ncbi:lipopolysaccharide assembly LapA domain-containing protein [Neisseria sp.]|uniref:LapA family protein n=1 Tax=Neisseria sp. TaxID=192066 RepID=UPI0026DD30D9|nr:lipopolysaccharide assembly protein LapA domain-containing protein [Neisseria sp.]MDO4226610.1 lipopolysaccharide assembly protein LapA domain-containing protein [Neisseria sp.]
MKIFYTIIKIIILLIFLILAVSNTQSVQFFYLPAQSVDVPLIVVLFGAFVIGSVFGIFALFGRLLALRSENNRLRAEVKKSARTAAADLAVPQPQNPAPSPLERKE